MEPNPQNSTVAEIKPSTEVVQLETQPNDTPKADVPELPPYSWHASEYIFHSKPVTWYLALWVIVLVVCGGLVFLQQWLSIAVIVVMALAISVYTRKEPRELQYMLDSHGVTVDGKLIAYNLFHSFSVAQEMSWHEIDLEPTKRFVPRLTLICATADAGQIEQILAAHLPRQDRLPDWVERASRRLRF